MDGAGHKIGSKDGTVPARDNSQGEIPGNHAVHRDHQRRCQGGEEEIPSGVMAPLLMFAGPAQGENSKDFLPKPCGFVSYCCQIGNQPCVPEKEAHEEVG